MLIYGNYSITAEKTVTGGIPKSWCDYSPEVTCGLHLAGAPIVMFINIYTGESHIRKTCNFDKPLNHILKVMDGCMHIFCLVKYQHTQN